MSDKPLKHRYQLFITEYIRTDNATEAALAAGYSAKTAGSKGHQLLKIIEIQQAIEQRRGEIIKKNELDIDDLVRGIRDIAENGQFEGNRLKAYDMLMRYIGAYKETNIAIIDQRTQIAALFPTREEILQITDGGEVDQ